MRLQFGRRFLVLYVLTVLCLGTVAVVVLGEDTGSSAPDPDSAASLSSAATGGPETGPTSGERPPGAPPSDGSSPGPGGIEAAPDDDPYPGLGTPPGASRGPGRLPVVPTVEQPESADGALVASHPRRVLPAAPGTQVLTSSVSPSPGRLQVTFTAHGRDPEDVLAFYRLRLTSLGFRETPGRAAGGAEAAFFAWRTSSVVITADPADDTYAVFAVLSTRRS
ncbi:hypothetical protein [Nocardioides sp. zg-DK7169]|uniref:hypothetical protein n=1 Tax=Nocardioides sp. zg-DK7169 TaxID=2736600 RepID=UPI001557B4C7|nr:hypothetical protein [Nocardioides sp. zg-DK7169]NPC97926.1 hypothetical protein [Nocardioides sp. zg-DK7169]